MRFIRSFILISMLLGFSTSLFSANYKYDFNSRCAQAYEAFSSLKIKEGERLLVLEHKENPNNLIPVFLENYSDFLRIFLLGDQNLYNARKKDFDNRLSLLNKGPKDDPWYRYCKSSAYFQGAILQLYFNHYLSAGAKFRNSFLLLEQNQKQYPDFKYNFILAGLEEAIVGTIPDKYRWLSQIMGMKGSVYGGVAKLSEFLENSHNSILKNDAVFYYCYTKFFLQNDKSSVRNYLNKNYPDVSNNLLLTFLKANLAINDNQAAQALKILNQRNKSSAYLTLPLFDYESGIAALRIMDHQTPIYFQNFLKANKGETFVKSSLQKLSYYYLITGNTQQANYYKNRILKEGNTLTDADKKAQRYAESGRPLPNKYLIAAQLYCDGGEYQKALKSLSNPKPSKLADNDEIAAYFYRYGRVYQLLGNQKGCIPFYEEAIRIGEDLYSQFGARAALDLGSIYEQKGEKDKAIFYYKKCLNMKNKDFKTNLDQKAKAGLSRLSA